MKPYWSLSLFEPCTLLLAVHGVAHAACMLLSFRTGATATDHMHRLVKAAAPSTLRVMRLMLRLAPSPSDTVQCRVVR